MPDTSGALRSVCAHVHTRVTEQEEIPDVTVLLPGPLQRAQLRAPGMAAALAGKAEQGEPLP